MHTCPCDSGLLYADCCQAFLLAQKFPTTPEALMRSRYTAYTEANTDYIARTMKAPASLHFDPESAHIWARQVTWLKLEVLSQKTNGAKGVVEFRAHYLQDQQARTLHEISEFRRDQGRWYYVSGKILEVQ